MMGPVIGPASIQIPINTSIITVEATTKPALTCVFVISFGSSDGVESVARKSFLNLGGSITNGSSSKIGPTVSENTSERKQYIPGLVIHNDNKTHERIMIPLILLKV